VTKRHVAAYIIFLLVIATIVNFGAPSKNENNVNVADTIWKTERKNTYMKTAENARMEHDERQSIMWINDGWEERIMEEKDLDKIALSSTRQPATWCMLISTPGYYELTGDIIDCDKECGIYINASDVVLNGMGHIVDGLSGSSYKYGIRVDHATNVTIMNMTIKEWYWRGIYVYCSSNISIINNTIETINNEGIRLYESSNSSILGNIVRDVGTGIDLYYSDNNTVMNNTCEDSSYEGICIDSSSYNVLVNNFVQNNRDGLYLTDSNNNTLIDNVARGNWEHGVYFYQSHNNTLANTSIQNNENYGIYLYRSHNNSIKDNNIVEDGIFPSESYDNIVENNLVNNKPLIYLENQKDLAIDSDAGQIVVLKCENIVIENQNITQTDVGVFLEETNRTIVKNNILLNNTVGIYLGYSANNTIRHNRIEKNEDGVCIYASTNNTITYNTIQNNLDDGIYLSYYSSNNTITYNMLKHNDDGICLSLSSNNTIYLNNFIENARQYYISGGSGNKLYSPQPLTYYYKGNQYTNHTGNYWSDYTGSDPDGDGIGNTLHGSDSYPLMWLAQIENEEIVLVPMIIQIVYPQNQTIANKTTITLKWTTTNVTLVDHYEVYVNGSPKNTSIAPTQAEYILTLQEGRNNVTVIAKDMGNNVAASWIYILIDTTPPTLTITSPQNNSILNTPTIMVEWYGEDALAQIDHYELYIDNQQENSDIPPTQTTYVISLDEGQHNITVKAVDKVGNIAIYTVQITLDLTKPYITIISPQNNTVINTTTIIIKWSGEDSLSGIHHYEIYLNNSPINTDISSDKTNYTLILAAGSYTISIIAVDNAGNSARCLVTFKVVIPSITSTETVTMTTIVPMTTIVQSARFYGLDALHITLLAITIIAIVSLIFVILKRKRKE